MKEGHYFVYTFYIVLFYLDGPIVVGLTQRAVTITILMKKLTAVLVCTI
jgi:hypothetical protein